jgi:hypothetical protein
LMPRKPPAKRVLLDMAGSSVADEPAPAEVAPEPAPIAKKRGRPRKHPNNAAKQAAYRKRKQHPEREALIRQILLFRVIRDSDHELTEMSVRELKRWKKIARGN